MAIRPLCQYPKHTLAMLILSDQGLPTKRPKDLQKHYAIFIRYLAESTPLLRVFFTLTDPAYLLLIAGSFQNLYDAQSMWKILLLGNSGQAYNVGSEEEIDIRSLAELIIKITGSRSNTTIVPSKSIPHSIATPARAIPSIQKIKEIGHSNKISLEPGLKRLIDWYKNQKP